MITRNLTRVISFIFAMFGVYWIYLISPLIFHSAKGYSLFSLLFLVDMCVCLIPFIVFYNLVKNYTKNTVHSFCVLLGFIVYFSSRNPAKYYSGLPVIQGLEPMTYSAIEDLIPLFFGYLVYKFTYILLKKYSLLKSEI